MVSEENLKLSQKYYFPSMTTIITCMIDCLGGDKNICNNDGIYAMDFATNAGKYLTRRLKEGLRTSILPPMCLKRVP